MRGTTTTKDLVALRVKERGGSYKREENSMCAIDRGKDSSGSKRENKWVARDPRGDGKDATKSTSGAGFEQEEGH